MTVLERERHLADLRSVVQRMTPAQVAAFARTVPEQDLPILERVVAEGAASHWRADPARMGVELGRDNLVLKPLPYVHLLGEKFRDAVEGRSKRQIWNLPPQHAKTTIASRWGPAWALDHDPSLRIILTSYGDDLAQENGDAVREILRTHSSLLRAQLRPDRQERGRFVTPEGGGVLAKGINASITGFSAGGIVIDDPFKNWQEAHSHATREKVWNQYRSTLRTRQASDDFWIVLVMTRWHEDDLTARLLAAEGSGDGEAWELVRLPEVAEQCQPESDDRILREPDPLGRAPGELLGRFSPESVDDRRLAAASYLWAGMHQQRPAPEEGGELKRAWWRLETTIPTKFDQSCTSWDMKLKDKEAGDFVVGQAWGRTASDFWLIDQLRGQWDQPTTENAIALLYVRTGIRRHYIENTGNGPEVMAALRAKRRGYVVTKAMAGQLGMTDVEREAVQSLRRRGMPGLLPVTVKGSKTVRARAESPYLEAGNVHLPERAPYTAALIDEAAAFPNGAHDDQVDAWSQAMSKLARTGAKPSAPKGALPKADPRRRSAGPLVISPLAGRR